LTLIFSNSFHFLLFCYAATKFIAI